MMPAASQYPPMKLANITRDLSGHNKIIVLKVMANRPRIKVIQTANLISLFHSHALVEREKELPQGGQLLLNNAQFILDVHLV